MHHSTLCLIISVRDHGILRYIFFGARKLRAKTCQTLGNKPNDSHPVLRGRLFSEGKI